VNDYLARRDARWMGGIYEWFGLTVGYVQRDMNTEARKKAYGVRYYVCHGHEVGFDYLRDHWLSIPRSRSIVHLRLR